MFIQQMKVNMVHADFMPEDTHRMRSVRNDEHDYMFLMINIEQVTTIDDIHMLLPSISHAFLP
jgi:hypothetical protein